MAGNDNENYIVRRYQVKNAPTGESTRYVTADGYVWREVYTNPPARTGECKGQKHGNTIRRW